MAAPSDALTPADVAGGVDVAKPSGVAALLYTDIAGIPLKAAPLNEVAAAVPRPPAYAALPHGTAERGGATRRPVTLDRTPVDLVDSSQSRRKVEKSCITFLLRDPGWYVHMSDVQNKWDDNTHTHTHTISIIDPPSGGSMRVA